LLLQQDFISVLSTPTNIISIITIQHTNMFRKFIKNLFLQFCAAITTITTEFDRDV